jgi:hypothetical protein
MLDLNIYIQFGQIKFEFEIKLEGFNLIFRDKIRLNF